VSKTIFVLIMVMGMLAMLYAAGTLAGNALPYPDPTPALLATQSAKVTLYTAIFVGGLLAAVCGGLGWWLSIRAAKRSSAQG
jgi:hypothetical protein